MLYSLKSWTLETKIRKYKLENNKTIRSMRNALSKINYIILLIGSILIITGYVLMSGEGSTPAAYNPDIFSRLRICFAPIICLLGYLLNVVGIIYITKKNN